MSSLAPKTYMMALTAEQIEQRLLSIDNMLSKDVIRQSLSSPDAATVPSTKAVADALTPITQTLDGLGDLASKDSVALDSNETGGVLPISKGGSGGSNLSEAQQNLGILSETQIQQLINESIPTIQQVWLDSAQVNGILPIAKGGTGASSPAQALKNLGIHDSNGKVPVSQLPAVALTDTFPVSSEAQMLGLTAQPGDVAIRSDVNKTFILMQEPASTISNWKELLNDAETKLIPQIRESLRRSYAEAGLTVMPGSFSEGGTLNSTSEVLINAADGKAYSWNGTYPPGGYVVTPGTDPTTVVGFISMHNSLLKGVLYSGQGTNSVRFNRGATNSQILTLTQKLLTVRHCSDWGIKCDGTDETAKLQALAADINAIPNPNGYPVKIVFSGQTDVSTPVLSFTTTVKFTRPVFIDGCGETMISYLGTGSTNAFEFGPATLTGDSISPTGFVVHKYYTVANFVVIGGTTSGVCFYFNNYIIYPKVKDCIFKYFGGNGSWAVKFQSNNWWAVVQDCSFDAHNISHSDDGVKRNFVSCPGVALDGTRDEFATRLHAIDNQIFASGWTMGGIAYLLSGWKSRIVGGSIEGMKTDIIIGAGCNDIEIDANYSEKNYPEEASSYIQLSYAGDPYFAVYPWVKRLKVRDMYINMHNTDANATPARFQTFANNVKIQDWDIDGVTLVSSAYELLSYPEIAGHTGNRVNNIILDGDLGAKSLLIDPSYASVYPAGFRNSVKNFSKLVDFSNIVSAVTGAAPLNGTFGITGLTVTSNGSGGAYTFTNGASDNTSASGYERNKLGGQRFYGAFRCTSAPSGQTFLIVSFELNANKNELINNDVVISFWAKANGSPVSVGAIHVMEGSGTQTQSQNTQVIATGSWLRYAMLIKVPNIPLGEAASSVKQSVGITLPVNATFDFNIAGVMVSKGGTTLPFSCGVQ